MGRTDTLDRIAQALIGLVALFALLNGSYMLADPTGWYDAVETVRFTGPPNAHFIRDVGLSFLGSGALLAYAALWPNGRWLAAIAGNLWLTAHAALHFSEVVGGTTAGHVFWQDAPGVIGPPLLVWVAIAILFARQRITFTGIPKPLMLRAIDQLSPGESAYLHEVASASGHAFEKLQAFMPITTHRHDAPRELFHMARIGATIIEDCGPCALTAANGALTDGVSRELVNAALAGTLPAGDLRTAYDFGVAISQQSADAFAYGDAIEASHGRSVRRELAITAATVRAYPAMKRGLGLTKSCASTRLTV